MKRTSILLPALALLALGACTKKPQPVSAPQTTTGREAANNNDAARREAEERARREAEEARRREEMARAQAELANTIFFDFDSFNIREDSKRILDSKVPILRTYPSFSLLIAGHADERGSTEYNLALGMRRANATRDYLTGFGIEASRLEVTSLGEEQPLDPSGTDAAMAKNRRAEFQPARSGR